ncbi:hypothetical protein EC957_005635 [Mortierella hygrophila]|uniref:Uncharacterized protein n=1 Tax=Mortierella hygrophila TaxID=979708 RepID=A0A9P6JZK7_9FUNG|nr:hypothetical protein EC957_005635 [Mortierella hygrophila]
MESAVIQESLSADNYNGEGSSPLGFTLNFGEATINYLEPSSMKPELEPDQSS